jgi:hypothetical protein
MISQSLCEDFLVFFFFGERGRIELTTNSLWVEPLNWQPLHVGSLNQKGEMMQPFFFLFLGAITCTQDPDN